MSEWAAVGQTAVDSDVRYVATCGAAQLETGSHLWTGKEGLETRLGWLMGGGVSRAHGGGWNGPGAGMERGLSD